MRFDDLVTAAVSLWSNSYVATGDAPPFALVVLGPPGIGKTSTAREMADQMTAIQRQRTPDAPEAICEVLDLSSRLPEDIGGLPFRDKDGGIDITVYAIQRWMARLCQPGAYGVLCLDDLPAATPAVQVAVRQIVLDRKAGENVLSPGIFIMTTGNRREDKSGASTLPAHFRNSTCIVGVEPDFDEWEKWYGKQATAPVVAAFLKWRPLHFSKLPKEADKKGAFATPRTWTLLGRGLEVAQKGGYLLELAGGLVGEGVATEFQAFINVRNQLVDPAKVLNNPKEAIPHPSMVLDTPDKAYALTTGMGEVAASWTTGPDAKKRKEAPLLFLRAVGHVTAGTNNEYIATAVSTFTSNGGSIKSLVAVARANMGDPLVKSVIEFLSKTFSGGR